MGTLPSVCQSRANPLAHGPRRVRGLAATMAIITRQNCTILHRWNLGEQPANPGIIGERKHAVLFSTVRIGDYPMETLTIQVTQDHIDRIAKAKKPILGIAELIWNSVDADAKHVT